MNKWFLWVSGLRELFVSLDKRDAFAEKRIGNLEMELEKALLSLRQQIERERRRIDLLENGGTNKSE